MTIFEQAILCPFVNQLLLFFFFAFSISHVHAALNIITDVALVMD